MSAQVQARQDQLCARTAPCAPPKIGGLAPWRAKRVMHFIEDYLNTPLTVAQIAAVSGVGPGHFGKACKDTFGLTPHALITQRRLARAKVLMATTGDPLNQIALACGFTDQSHFTNRFRRAQGMTPNAWRRAHVSPAKNKAE